MATIWHQLCDRQTPFTVLAPMDDVTDVVFREVVAETAPPDLFFTEFANVEALQSPGRAAHGRRLDFTEQQRPIIAQIWGKEPQNFYAVARQCAEQGFDGIDLNMGCPDKKVIKSGLCAALIENRPLAAEIIAATKEGANGVPVSVKTRLGIKAPVTEDWIGWLLEQGLAAITLHGRTVADMSQVPARWDEISRAVAVRDAVDLECVFVGNGDVASLDEANARAHETGVDGVMIGRGIFQNPWVFAGAPRHPVERLRMLARHIELWEQTWGDDKNPHILRKFLAMYMAGFPGAKDMRTRAMATDRLHELAGVVTTSIAELENSSEV